MEVGTDRLRVSRRAARSGRTDRGFTLVETLIAVVLLGSTVVATVVALRVTTIGSTIERDHAKAYQWLQSATGVLQAAERVSCDLGEAAVRAQYQEVVRKDVVNPPDWEDRQLTIVPPVKAWDGSAYLAPGDSAKYCHDSDGFKLQLITLQVTSPDGRIIETLQVVKHG